MSQTKKMLLRSSERKRGRLQIRKTAVKIVIVIVTRRKSWLLSAAEPLVRMRVLTPKLMKTITERRMRLIRLFMTSTDQPQSGGSTALVVVHEEMGEKKKTLETPNPKKSASTPRT